MLLSARSRREHLHNGLALSKSSQMGRLEGTAEWQVARILSNLGFDGHEHEESSRRDFPALLSMLEMFSRGAEE